MPQTDISWALAALSRNTPDYDKAAAYYDGDHKLTFATEKFRNQFGRLFQELSINHCAVVVDVPADKLQLDEFVVSGGGEGTWKEIWRRNRMNKRQGEVHTEALKTGDGYVVVDWVNRDDPSTDRATIYPNQAGRCAVKYDDENPGYIVQAARWWLVPTDGKFVTRLNLYYRDKVEKYASKPRGETATPVQVRDFSPIEQDPVIPNPYNKVPVFHFANNAPIGERGRSELRDVIPSQDALNKTVCDALVGAEYAALGQRVVVGLEPETDENGNPRAPFRDGLANLWLIPPQKDKDGAILPADQSQPVSYGQFNPANLDQLLSMKASFRKDISLISGIPAHYFMDATGGFPSGEALKTAEQRLTSKVIDRQIAFGNVWEDVARFCLEIEGVKDAQVEARWKDAAPMVAPSELPRGATS